MISLPLHDNIFFSSLFYLGSSLQTSRRHFCHHLEHFSSQDSPTPGSLLETNWPFNFRINMSWHLFPALSSRCLILEQRKWSAVRFAAQNLSGRSPVVWKQTVPVCWLGKCLHVLQEQRCYWGCATLPPFYLPCKMHTAIIYREWIFKRLIKIGFLETLWR